jgi:hypothetical protein
LSELFELEMDLEKNQYETEAPVAFDSESSPQEQVDDAISKLQELARRQEQLAEQANRRNGLTEQERWQQESLRRETEELKRQLEEMQQRLAQQQQQQGQQGQQQEGQQGQQGQQGQPGQQGQQGQQGQANANGQGSQTQQAIDQLNQALQAMNQASGQGQQGQQMSPEEARRAIEQARRQLQEALQQLTAERQAAVGQAFEDLAQRSQELYEEQRQVANDLQEALRSSPGAGDPQQRRRGAIPDDQAEELAERKYDLQQELEALEEDIQRVAQQFREQTPEASDALNQALADLQSVQTGARLGYGGDAILRGAGAQVAATDSVTTSALRDLQRNTEEAQTLANAEAVAGERTEADPNAELRAEIQNIRRQLNEITQQQGQAQNGQGQQGQEGQQGQQAQQGQGQQAGQGGAQANAGGNQGGQVGDRNGGFGPGGVGNFYDWRRGGVWDPRNRGLWDNPGAIDEVQQQLNDASRELLTLGNELRTQGLSDEELRAVRELGDALRGSITGNPDLIEQEFQQLVNLAEQLELKLAENGDTAERAAVRAQAPTQVAPGFEEAVAEYYRRLSRSER